MCGTYRQTPVQRFDMRTINFNNNINIMCGTYRQTPVQRFDMCTVYACN